MAFFSKTSHIDFVGKRRFFLTLSAIVVTLSLGIFLTKGLNYGIDFLGGTELQLKFQKPTQPSELREALVAINMQDATVQVFGDPAANEFLIRVQSASSDPQQYDQQLRAAVSASLKTDEGNALEGVRYVGDKAYLKLKRSTDVERLLSSLKQAQTPDFSVYEVVPFGKESEHEYLVRFSGVSKLITAALEKSFGQGAFELRREDSVGPKVGRELRQKGVAAILMALLFILIYIWMRFDLTYAPGAVVALLHDLLITVGIFSVLNIEVNLPIIAALLTIVGYSLNDTIVVYDRIRENVRGKKGTKLEDVINLSVNQTLSRTVMTSITTLLVTVALFLFGGPIIHNFALALTIGVVVGTYSSIFVASPMVIFLTHYAEVRRVKAA